MQEETPRKLRIWLWLIPVYIALLIPLVRWTLKIYSPDIELSKEELSAFSATGEFKEEDYQVREPNLKDVAFAVNYRNQGSALDEKDPYENLEKMSANTQREYLQKNKDLRTSSNKNEKEIERRDRQEKYNQSVDKAKQGQMMSVGYKQGFLTKSVSGIMNNPSAVKSLFNNTFVVKGFMSRETVKSVLSSKQSLENFLTRSQKVSNFLNNDIVKKVMNNPQIFQAIASSALIGEFMKAPAVWSLMNDQNAINRIINSNPQLAQLLSNPNVKAAIASNPQASQAMMNLQTLKK